MDRVVLQPTAEARLYALRELCRRAGLRAGDFAAGWRIEQDSDSRLLRLAAMPPASGKILFPAFDAELNAALTVRKQWPWQAPENLCRLVPDFVVPYARSSSNSAQPLFVQIAPGVFQCTEDLLASTVLVLSRFEELESTRLDAHRRFSALHSMAFRDRYLDRPIVDEYGFALRQLLQALVPAFLPNPVPLRVKVSHDVDNICIPFNFREPAVQMLGRRYFGTGIRDLLSGVAPVAPGSLRLVKRVCELTAQFGLRSTLYWKASHRTEFDSGYDIEDPRVAALMDWARTHEIEMGVHPGYETFLAPEKLCDEVARCRQALGSHPIGGRQHYLRWHPDTWAHWESCGLAYDSTVGYADRAGFRAGTCCPYFPWLWRENRTAQVLEIPLILMDRTLVSKEYMGLTPLESRTLVGELMQKCAAVGGVITVLWHNTCLGQPYSAHLRGILETLAGLEEYNWKAEIECLQASPDCRTPIRW